MTLGLPNGIRHGFGDGAELPTRSELDAIVAEGSDHDGATRLVLERPRVDRYAYSKPVGSAPDNEETELSPGDVFLWMDSGLAPAHVWLPRRPTRGHWQCVKDWLGNTGVNTITVHVPAGYYLDGVLNGTHVIDSFAEFRWFAYLDDIDGVPNFTVSKTAPVFRMTPPIPDTYIDEDRIVAWFREQGDGTIWTDISGNGNHAVVAGTVKRREEDAQLGRVPSRELVAGGTLTATLATGYGGGAVTAFAASLVNGVPFVQTQTVTPPAGVLELGATFGASRFAEVVIVDGAATQAETDVLRAMLAGRIAARPTPAAPEFYAPSVAGLVCWLREQGDDETWTDLSGQGNHATVAGAVRKKCDPHFNDHPTYTQSRDVVGQITALVRTPNAGSKVTIYSVLRRTAYAMNTANEMTLFTYWTQTYDGYDPLMDFGVYWVPTHRRAYVWRNAFVGRTAPNPVVHPSYPALAFGPSFGMRVQFDGTGCSMRVDSRESDYFTGSPYYQANGPFDGASALRIGWEPGASHYRPNASYAEFIVIHGVPTEAEDRAIRAGISARYGIEF